MSSLKPHAVLLAEDDENDVFFLQRAFAQAQVAHPLYRVHDGEEAIDYLSGEGAYGDRSRYPLPQLLLLDLKMPRKNGFEVLAWVRAQDGLKRLPVIVLSYSKEYPDINRAYDLGPNTYLVKPVKFESLLKMIEALNTYWLMLAEKPGLQR